MLNWLKNPKNLWKIKIVSVRWYPSNRSCVNTNSSKAKLDRMPPLMVRKPAWRR